MAIPNFHGRRGENAGNFLDDLEMAFLVSGREDEEIKLRAFPLVLREEAKVWFQDLDMGKQGNWEALKRAFLLRYIGDNNPEEIWRKLSKLQQASPDSYSEYEIQFLKLWTQWENSLPEGERAPNFLQKERFLAGLTPILREKVKCKFPESFKEALTWARLKDRKLQFQKSWRDHSQAASRVTTQEQAHPSSPNGSGDPHLDRLQRVTKQLDSLSINLIHGLQPKKPVQQQAGGQGTNDEVPRRPPRREYQCHNYGEDEHGMYFCHYPRGYGNAPPRGPQQQVSPLRMRPPPMPMCEQQQQPQQHQPIQILRQSTYAPVPQPTTEVPPLPHDGVEQAMNVISCEDKGEEKILEAEAMTGKQATVAKEPRQMTTNDGANKKEKKRKKKASMTRRKIGIINFPVKSKPQDLIEEVQRQEHKLTWPQLLHLSPRMRRQWSKMVSTRRSKSVNTLKAQVLEDDVPVLDTQIKGQRVSSDYVDGGEQVCVISKKMMHKLRLEVSGPSGFKGNDVSVKYVGVVTVCGIQFGVDMYVLPARGEGYPIILGRPWLIAMNVRQDWESRTLLLKPPRKEGKSIQTIVYNMKEGRKESSELETLENEWSTEDSSSMAEVTSSVNDSESEKSSLLEAMGVVLTRPTTQDGGSIKETLSDEKIEDMLSTNLSKEERKEFEVMLQKHSPLFILDYKQIKGVTVCTSHSQMMEVQSKALEMLNKQLKLDKQRSAKILQEANELEIQDLENEDEVEDDDEEEQVGTSRHPAPDDDNDDDQDQPSTDRSLGGATIEPPPPPVSHFEPPAPHSQPEHQGATRITGGNQRATRTTSGNQGATGTTGGPVVQLFAKSIIPTAGCIEKMLIQEPEVMEQTAIYRIIKKQTIAEALEAATSTKSTAKAREKKPLDKGKINQWPVPMLTL
ncbi:hypothetical protein L7F22_010415 [Adiantum nelumboides]|nr:hypothetical protein [Adiantum nelumboides]